ncbi:MAG: hypothetical protein AABY64_07275 [Bdellovibrionota bacterium]
MKTITRVLFAVIAFGFVMPAFASSIECNFEEGASGAIGIGGDAWVGSCRDGGGRNYEITLYGLGGGLGVANALYSNSATFTCPFVKNLAGFYGGAKVSVVIGKFSLNPNLYLGKGLCTLHVNTQGAGVLVTVGKIKVRRI